ncbi:MAG: NTPase [Promethearchaeota archaeon]
MPLLKVNVLVTGRPGCGKSTLVNRLIEKARAKGIIVGGISTPEFRLSTGKRGGFLIQDIATGEKQIMASANHSSPVLVGRYGVDLQAIQDVGVKAINSAVAKADLVVIDEIGKMELAVSEFKLSVAGALNSSKPVLGTIGMWVKTAFVVDIKNRSDVTLLVLTPETRDQVYQNIVNLFGL